MSIRIHHLNCGTMCPLCSRLMNDVNGSWAKPGHLVCHCLLIETPETLVLVDTGLGHQDVVNTKHRLGSVYPALFRPQLKESETAISQIKALGYDPRDVRHIALTHVDLDHAGGLSDFPEATVHIFKPELEQILKPTWQDRQRFRLVQFDHQPKWQVHEEGGDEWFGFSSIRAIPNISTDILLIPLIGHTRGHTGIAVKQGDKWLLHCGDSYYHHSQITTSPQAPIGLTFFEAAVQSLREPRIWNQGRLRDLAANHGNEVELFCSHDPVELARYTTSGIEVTI